MLYYKSVGTTPTLLRMGNISGRLYGWTIIVIIINDYKHILYIFHINDKLSSHNVACAL